MDKYSIFDDSALFIDGHIHMIDFYTCGSSWNDVVNYWKGYNNDDIYDMFYNFTVRNELFEKYLVMRPNVGFADK